MAAKLLGKVVGGLTDVHSSIQNPKGTRSLGYNSSDELCEFIYLSGVASLVAEDFVVYDEDYATTRAVADEVGSVAVAMAAVDATTKYGWFQIYGPATGDTATVAADKTLYLTATAGRLDDTDVAGDSVHGCFSMAADTSNSCPVFLNYPFVTDIAHD